MRKIFLAFLLLFSGQALAQESLADPATAEGTAQIEAAHESLRGLRDRLVAAVNAKDEAALLADLDDKILFTAMNNEVAHGKEEASAYYAKMLVGSQRIVKNMSLTAEADDLSILLAEGEVAIAAGNSVAHFDMMGGQSFDVPLRWTATLTNKDGAWKVAAIHFSANMFENPIMSGVEHFAYWLAGGLGLLGLLIGWLIGRRRKSA